MLVGTYAQAAVLGRGRMSHRVRDYRQYLTSLFPLPHPSWRSQLWIQQNPWVDSELLPTLRNDDRKSVVWGKSVPERVDLGGRRINKKKNQTRNIPIHIK